MQVEPSKMKPFLQAEHSVVEPHVEHPAVHCESEHPDPEGHAEIYQKI
jgi:hypothetical protein